MLHCAAHYGHIKAMRYCLKKAGGQLEDLLIQKQANTPLLTAIEAGELGAFWLLLNHDPDLAAKQLEVRNNHLLNPLMSAFLHGRVEMALYLLTKYEDYYVGDLDFVDSDGNTLLHLAAKSGLDPAKGRSSVYLAKMLHRFSVGQIRSMLIKPNNDGFPPLYLAVVEGNYYFVEHVLDKYADVVIRTVHARSKDGERLREWLHRNAGYAD